MLFLQFSGEKVAREFRYVLLVFLGQDTPDWAEILSAFGDWTKKNIVPPRTLLVGTSEHVRLLSNLAYGSETPNEYLDAFERQSRLILSGFDDAGNLDECPIEPYGSPRRFNDLFEHASKEFFIQASQRGDVVVAAPPGFYFAKQSDRFSSHFLRAESLLRGTDEIEFLACRLLRSFSQFCGAVQTTSTIRIFIDSMAIWPVAEKLIAAHGHNNDVRRYKIESFRGYEGLDSWDPQPGPAFVLISASTSGGLEARVKAILGFRAVDVITLLGLEELHEPVDSPAHARASQCLYRVPRKLVGEPGLEGLRSDFQPDVALLPAGTEGIRVIGERFLSHNNRPKLVRLAHKALGTNEKKALFNLAKNHLVVIGRKRAIGNARWSMSLDLRALINKYTSPSEDTPSLVEEWVRNYAVPGPVAVIYPRDVLPTDGTVTPYNELLAGRVKTMLLTRSAGADVRLLNHEQLSRPDNELKAFLRSAGVIVTSPIVSNGFIFKQISALLRLVQPTGPRLYIALAVLPESSQRLKEISSDLESNADNGAYHFKYAVALSVGRLDTTVRWQQETALLHEVAELCEEQAFPVPALLTQRIEALRTQTGLSDQLALLPSSSGAPQHLSAGFLLWASDERLEGDNFGGSVFLTVATFLEACRNARSGDVETSLRSGVFQQSLIDPATFTRFNDGAIQGALLRAAYPAELNYAVDTEASRDMRRLLIKFLELHDEPAGGATPEFLLALALERLTLRPDDLEIVRDTCSTLPGWLRVLAQRIPAPGKSK